MFTFAPTITTSGNFSKLSKAEVLELVLERMYVPRAALDALARAAEDVLYQQTNVAPLPDWDKLGHPYARRWGHIRYVAKGGHPAYNGYKGVLVHREEGHLAKLLYSELREQGVVVGFHDELEAQQVVYGTRLMLPRDIVRATFNNAGVRDFLVKQLAAAMRVR